MLLARSRMGAPAIRLRRGRASRAPRAAPVAAHGAALCAGTGRGIRLSLAYSEHEADVLGRWLGERGVGARRVRAVRRGRRGVRADRRASGCRRHLGGRRSSPRLRAAARQWPGQCPRRASSPSRRPTAPARSPVGRATSRSRPTSRSTRCAAASSEARVVALPVRENSYSGATTVLLQAMALARPVVVTRTAAIAAGYGLEDGRTCRLVAAGRAPRLRGRARGAAAGTTGAHGRSAPGPGRPSRAELTWDRYAERLDFARASCCSRRRTPRALMPGISLRTVRGRSIAVGGIALLYGLATRAGARGAERHRGPGSLPQRRREDAGRGQALFRGDREQGPALLLHVRATLSRSGAGGARSSSTGSGSRSARSRWGCCSESSELRGPRSSRASSCTRWR